MSIKNEAKRVKYGQKLIDLEAQAMSAISSLKTIKKSLGEVKKVLEADADFAEADIKEFSDLTTKLITEINNI